MLSRHHHIAQSPGGEPARAQRPTAGAARCWYTQWGRPVLARRTDRPQLVRRLCAAGFGNLLRPEVIAASRG